MENTLWDLLVVHTCTSTGTTNSVTRYVYMDATETVYVQDDGAAA